MCLPIHFGAAQGPTFFPTANIFPWCLLSPQTCLHQGRKDSRCESDGCTVQFAEEALLLLTALAKEPDASPGGGAWFGAGDCSEPRNALKTFLASSVENSFIPTVFLDFK